MVVKLNRSFNTKITFKLTLYIRLLQNHFLLIEIGAFNFVISLSQPEPKGSS